MANTRIINRDESSNEEHRIDSDEKDCGSREWKQIPNLITHVWMHCSGVQVPDCRNGLGQDFDEVRIWWQ